MPNLWEGVRLVAFDVDGTLYHQEKLRRLMLGELLLDLGRNRSTRTLKLLRDYRRGREVLAEEEVADFEAILQGKIAASHGCSSSVVGDIVSEWIHRRPLRHLRRCAVAGVHEAFAKVRASGRMVGVLSDYPAEAKLASLGLEADYVVSADGHGVNRLKPHPAGLLRLIELAGSSADCTVLVGDRTERDVEAARRAGARWLLRTRKPRARSNEFSTFLDAPFDLLPSTK